MQRSTTTVDWEEEEGDGGKSSTSSIGMFPMSSSGPSTSRKPSNNNNNQSSYIAFVTICYMISSLGMMIQQHMILWTGIYKFNYPIVLTVVQFVITQFFFYVAAYLSRLLRRPLTFLKLDFIVAPTAVHKAKRNSWGWGSRGSIFEFEWNTAKNFLLVSFVFTMKLLLSNLSFAYAQLTLYQASRILSLPMALAYTAFLQGRTLSASTLSSCVTISFCLLMCSLRSVRFSHMGFLLGISSSVFVALYPFILLRSYNNMLNHLNSSSGPRLTTLDRRRAAWRLLNYINILSFMYTAPLSIVSGAALNVWRTCYFLDAPFFWLMLLISGCLAFFLFASLLALVRCTSPLTAVVAAAPREALQTVFLNHFKLQSWNWVGVWMCWGASFWYLFGRNKEAPRQEVRDVSEYPLMDMRSGGGGNDREDEEWDD